MRRRPTSGFTLIELVMVISIIALVAAAVVVFIRPATQAYIGTSYRADMSVQLDGALRRMLRDVRRAVPNSIRAPAPECFELVPTVAGGRYRTGPDRSTDAATCFPQPTPPTAPSASCTAYVDPSQSTVAFDVLSRMSTTPVSDQDFVVINNQNGNDVYSTGANRSLIKGFSNHNAPLASDYMYGEHRMTISALQVSPGYTSARFQVVSGTEQSVFYVCQKEQASQGNTLSSGDGNWTLYRMVRPFQSTYPSACPTVSSSNATVVARRLTSCTFVYNPNQGATQQSGYIWMSLQMSRNNELAQLIAGGHVMNVP